MTDIVGQLETAAARGLDGTGLDGRVLFGDPRDVWSLGSAQVEATGLVHLDLLVPPSVAIDVIERMVAGERVGEPEDVPDEFEDESAWQAYLAALAKGPGRSEVRAFGEIMEGDLISREKRRKRAWKDEDPLTLFDTMLDATQELREAILSEPRSAPHIGRKASRVASFALMVADACGGLG